MNRSRSEEIAFAVEPKIICYAAKWQSGSPEFRGTTPQFAPVIDPRQRGTMLQLASRVHDLLGLRDYGRVDFRLDADGQAYVLEANPNPDITPGSGYCLALDAARISYPDFLSRLVANALQRRQSKTRTARNP